MPNTNNNDGITSVALSVNNNMTRQEALPNVMSMEQFDKILPKIARQGKALRQLVQDTALQAMFMAFAHDDFTPYTKLYNVVVNNLSPKQGEVLKNWFTEFSPCRLAKTDKGSSFRKDKSENAKPFDFETAFETPWWKMQSDAEKALEAIALNANTLHEDIAKIIKNYQKVLDEGTVQKGSKELSIANDDKESVQNTLNALENILEQAA